jgi:circadian clock protein KaiC
MDSVGIDLGHWAEEGLLRFVCTRPSLLGLEAHLSAMQEAVIDFDPAVIVMDPISDLMSAGASRDVSAMLTRQVDFLKMRGITALFVTLNAVTGTEATHHQVTSLIDVWLQLRMFENNGERNLSLSVLKARGTGHSNQIRELQITSQGLQLAGEHGPGQVLTGSARREAARQAAALSAAGDFVDDLPSDIGRATSEGDPSPQHSLVSGAR